jgi:nucleotide-binding universal stress UspA family protein
MPKTLIVPVDGTITSEQALRVARRLADSFGECEVVALAAAAGDREGQAREHLQRVIDDVGDKTVRAEFVVDDDLAGVIARTAASVPDGVVCMTTYGRGRLTEAFVSSLASDVLRLVKVPVLLVGPQCRPDWWQAPPRVLACWSGAESNGILAPARDWAHALDAELWVASVFHPLDTEMAAHPRHEFEPALDHLGRGVAARLLPIRSEYPAGALVEAATNHAVSVVAITTHAREGISRLALGSVAMQVVHESPCPVLVVGPGC